MRCRTTPVAPSGVPGLPSCGDLRAAGIAGGHGQAGFLRHRPALPGMQDLAEQNGAGGVTHFDPAVGGGENGLALNRRVRGRQRRYAGCGRRRWRHASGIGPGRPMAWPRSPASSPSWPARQPPGSKAAGAGVAGVEADGAGAGIVVAGGIGAMVATAAGAVSGATSGLAGAAGFGGRRAARSSAGTLGTAQGEMALRLKWYQSP